MKTVKAHQRILAVLALCFALAVLLAACGGDSSSGSSNSGTNSGSGSGSGAVAVTIDNFAFTAKPVKAGTSFKVQNKDGTEHTFTANNGAFDVDVPAGKTVTVKALQAGTYAFHCKIHTSMTGTLTVG